MSNSVIDRIDHELSSSTMVRSGMSAYATILRSYERLAKRDRAAADRQLEEAIVDLAARLYLQSSSRNTELLMFSDGANDCLFDATNERTVLMYGRSKTTPPNSRDTPYHQGYPRAGDGYDKGHALSHAQGGLEGGPNYFKQKRSVNQRRSGAGNLWRDIETYLAANAGVFAFVRLIYRRGVTGDMPFEAEYGILNGPGQFRVVIFPNH
jgi:hypothetical protein